MTFFFNVKEITSTFCFTYVLFFGLEINCHRLYRMKKYLDRSLGLFAWPCVDPKTALIEFLCLTTEKQSVLLMWCDWAET